MMTVRGMSVQLGDLTERVAIEENRETYDANGDPTEAWTVTDNRWARVESADGTEAVEAGRVTAEQRFKFTMRYVTNMTPANRLTWDSRTFEIKSVENPDAHKVAHVVVAVEVKTGG